MLPTSNAPTFEQAALWRREAEDEFDHYWSSQVSYSNHPSIRHKVRDAYIKGYLKAMFRMYRELGV